MRVATGPPLFWGDLALAQNIRDSNLPIALTGQNTAKQIVKKGPVLAPCRALPAAWGC